MSEVSVRLPTPLRPLAGGQAVIRAEGGTVGEVIVGIALAFPALSAQLLTHDQRLRSHVALYLNDEDVRYLAREATPVKDGDVVEIVPSLAGGSSEPEQGRGTIRADSVMSREEMRRYSRHLLLPEVGVAGQARLRRSKVLLVGAGGLGSPAALYLAAAGVGEIGLVDFDVVDASNLQRQVLYGTRDVGRPKLEAAKDRLEDLNPDVRVRTYPEKLESGNALEILRPYDVVVDGTDNFPTRYLVNDAAFFLGKPNVYGSVYRFEGQVSVFDARRGPCYRCLYPEPPPPGLVPSCAEGGVLGVLPGVIGLLQSIETLKLLLGTGESLVGRLLLFDALGLGFRELHLAKNPDCALCGPRATQTGLIDYPAFCGVGAAEASDRVPEIAPGELSRALQAADPPYLLDVREPEEWAIVRIEGAHLIPKGELPQRLSELTSAREVVLYCKSGLRSSEATRFLLDLGFNNVRNLRGGLDAWAREVDPDLARY